VGDIVYFSGLIEGFGDFCHEHGLEIVTNESSEATTDAQRATNDDAAISSFMAPTNDDVAISPLIAPSADDVDVGFSGGQIGSTEESPAERLRRINLMTGTYLLGSAVTLRVHNSSVSCVVSFQTLSKV
jgi:hypothetical protein